MSLSGITFANQKITPSDDGKLYGALLQDCILTGCGITFSAATLAIAAGALLIGTRELKTSGESLSISGATTGYARVLIDIDLTKAATESSFAQAEWQIEYASTADGFGILEQQDINTNGTHYQAVFCTMSLGAAGITSITSSMQTATLGTEIVGRSSMQADVLGHLCQDWGIGYAPWVLENNGKTVTVWMSDETASYSREFTKAEADALPIGYCVELIKVDMQNTKTWTMTYPNVSIQNMIDRTWQTGGSVTLKNMGDSITLFKDSNGSWRLTGNLRNPHITSGTADPSGGYDGDVYLKYEA